METGQKTIQKINRIDLTSNIKLSIHISLNGLSFCIVDENKNEIVFLKEIVFSLTITAPTCFRSHVDRVATSVAIFIK